jgi:hypothetical protein
MGLRRREVLKALGVSTAAAAMAGARDALAGGPVVRRDVCILGGGAAGTYAALRLRDLGKSVVVLERTARLGGHAETFHDPATGAPIDIGVIIFPDTPLVRAYFARFNVPLVTAGFQGASSTFVDFRTGLPVAAFNPSPAEVGAALFAYLQLVTGPFAFLSQNGYQLPSSGPLLDQLLLPFGPFVVQNGLTALLPTFFLFEQGFGALVDSTPALYVLKNMSPEVVGGVIGGSLLAVPTGVGALYDAATVALEGDVLFGTELLRVIRPPRGPNLVLARTAAGLRLIECDKLLVTAPPLVGNLRGFDLDHHEASLFGRFRPNLYATGVVRIDGLPPGVSLVNAAPETFENIAPLPGIYSLSPSPAPGLTNVKYGATELLPEDQIRAAIQADIERVQVPGIGPLQFEGFAVFKNHAPFALMVSPDDIRGGFYAALQALQGRRRTFYASATFQTHSSAAIWAFVEGLLPSLAA